MKKLLCIVIVLAVSITAKAFIVKVDDIPEAVIKYPIVIVSQLDNISNYSFYYADFS